MADKALSTAPVQRGVKPRKTAVTKCVYFQKESTISDLEQIVGQCPRSSVSGVISQLVDGFNKAYAGRTDKEKREINVTIKVFV